MNDDLPEFCIFFGSSISFSLILFPNHPGSLSCLTLATPSRKLVQKSGDSFTAETYIVTITLPALS